MLLSRRPRRIRDWHSRRNVQTAQLVDAVRQDLREAEKERSTDLRLEIRKTNRSRHGRPEEAEGEGSEEDSQRLG